MTTRSAVPLTLVLLIVMNMVSRPQTLPRPGQEPDPSYREDAVSNHRHPEVDTDVALFINHWRNAVPRTSYGGLIERAILTPGNPQHPTKKGAVLKYITSFGQAVLQPKTSTARVKDAKEQAFFYVTSGTGSIQSGRQRAHLEAGTAVVVPAGLEYLFVNEAEVPLEMIIATEDIAPGFKPNNVLSVGSSHDAEPAVGHHWAHIARGFLFDVPPKFSRPLGFIVVGMDAFDIAQPHTHPPGTEEIWCQLRGVSLLFFGNRLMRQEPGEAFLVPPNNRVPHSSINPTTEPMLWLFMGCRVEEK